MILAGASRRDGLHENPRKGNSRPGNRQGHRKVGVKGEQLLKTRRLCRSGAGACCLVIQVFISSDEEFSRDDSRMHPLTYASRFPLGTAWPFQMAHAHVSRPMPCKFMQ